MSAKKELPICSQCIINDASNAPIIIAILCVQNCEEKKASGNKLDQKKLKAK